MILVNLVLWRKSQTYQLYTITIFLKNIDRTWFVFLTLPSRAPEMNRMRAGSTTPSKVTVKIKSSEKRTNAFTAVVSPRQGFADIRRMAFVITGRTFGTLTFSTILLKSYTAFLGRIRKTVLEIKTWCRIGAL